MLMYVILKLQVEVRGEFLPLNPIWPSINMGGALVGSVPSHPLAITVLLPYPYECEFGAICQATLS
jgi:hypothetical protein